MASIGISTVAGSALQAKGWQLINDLVNRNTQVGLFNKDGNPFYIPVNPVFIAVAPDNADTTNVPNTGNAGVAGKVYDALTGSMESFKKSLSVNTQVEAGVVQLNYSNPTEITDAPLMAGQFMSYNKVVRPITANVNYVVTGTEKQRKYFEKALKKARASLQLFTLHTVELSIPYVNIIDFSITRGPESQQMYNASISVREVVQKANATSLGYATAGSGTSKDQGQLQTEKASGVQEQSAKKKP
ncbi:phage baseplate protein [Commensalibacter papalotli (ex Servin-Garciduenas et al. 2014)]|uniref:Dit-like phage tail protein N-terminal domain-containing protein n=1 Tax=Commensalibacter papalotli (ex Servin-Garciduenas et al. 2014) TaxID=1208583 RepID=W7DNG3_9PROT|nr:hypothetical protein [Commensalibacter papalotli (ex Servin-Garciduenas et al. 2014)]EUK18822.1 hypothetical protein COMX_03700 [Commensalibacter papalotli (ex Servin-Garciduenas et al. 2014)]